MITNKAYRQVSLAELQTEPIKSTSLSAASTRPFPACLQELLDRDEIMTMLAHARELSERARNSRGI